MPSPIDTLKRQATFKGFDLRTADQLAWAQLVAALPKLSSIEVYIRQQMPKRDSLHFWQTMNTAKNQLRYIFGTRPAMNKQANWEIGTARIYAILREVSQ